MVRIDSSYYMSCQRIRPLCGWIVHNSAFLVAFALDGEFRDSDLVIVMEEGVKALSMSMDVMISLALLPSCCLLLSFPVPKKRFIHTFFPFPYLFFPSPPLKKRPFSKTSRWETLASAPPFSFFLFFGMVTYQ